MSVLMMNLMTRFGTKMRGTVLKRKSVWMKHHENDDDNDDVAMRVRVACSQWKTQN